MRVSWIIFTALCTVVLLLSLCAGTVYFASGSGPGVAEPGFPPRREIPVEDVPALQPDLEDFESDGEFNAWLKHPEDVFEPNLMRLSIRLFPETNRFPGMQEADVNRLDDMIVQATVRVDVSVPLWNTQIANRPQSHIQREKATGSGGTRILSACDFECVGAARGCIRGMRRDDRTGALPAGTAR